MFIIEIYCFKIERDYIVSIYFKFVDFYEEYKLRPASYFTYF